MKNVVTMNCHIFAYTCFESCPPTSRPISFIFFYFPSYQWCSGVLAVSGVFIFGKYLSNQSHEFTKHRWKDSETLQRLIKDYFWGLPKDHLILQINPLQPKDAITAGCKVSLDDVQSCIVNNILLSVIKLFSLRIFKVVVRAEILPRNFLQTLGTITCHLL